MSQTARFRYAAGNPPSEGPFPNRTLPLKDVRTSPPWTSYVISIFISCFRSPYTSIPEMSVICGMSLQVVAVAPSSGVGQPAIRALDTCVCMQCISGVDLH